MLIIEDEELLWRGYRRSLSSYAVEFIATLAEARDRLTPSRWSHVPADVVVLDLNLPDGDGMTLVEPLSCCAPRPGVIVVSGFLNAQRLVELYRQRVLAIPKGPSREVLSEAIETALERPSYPDIVRRLCGNHTLSPAEAEVVLAAVDGCSVDETADRLGCSRRTVETHWQRVFKKTGYRSKPDVLAAVLRLV